MAMTAAQLRTELLADEPEYDALARQGPSVLPAVRALLSDANEYVAANAASLAGMIDSDESVALLGLASKSPSARVRAAAAGALRQVTRPAAAGVIATLLGDRDKSVRKFAIKAAGARSNPALMAKVGEISRTDPIPGLRTLAAQVMSGTRRA
jgi:HEAT repeat protein